MQRGCKRYACRAGSVRGVFSRPVIVWNLRKTGRSAAHTIGGERRRNVPSRNLACCILETSKIPNGAIQRRGTAGGTRHTKSEIVLPPRRRRLHGSSGNHGL